MAEGEVAALKEALCNQYIIMKKLYIELDEEREASATAASEALSMILRLQREKAAEKMEACQYKRMAEEKMHHAEESLMILEDIIQQKEFETASLKHQLQAYKLKMLSLGADELDDGEMRAFESPSLGGSCAIFDKTRFPSFVRKNISLPVFLLDQSYGDMDSICEDSPLHPTKQSMWRETETPLEILTSNLKQVEEAKERAEGLSQTKKIEEICTSESSLLNIESQKTANIDHVNLGEESSSCSWHSAVSCEGLSSLTYQAEDLGNIPVSYMPESPNTINSATVNDIFEIPESHKAYNLREPSKLELEESISETKHMIGMPNFMPREAADYIFKDDDWLNKAFMYTHHGSKASTPKKGSLVHRRSRISTPRKGASVNFHQARTETKTGISTPMADIEQVKQRLQRLEDERIMLEEDSNRSKEQIKLLREIFAQLTTIESHINTKRNTRKSHQQHESSIVSVMEIWRTLLSIQQGCKGGQYMAVHRFCSMFAIS